MTVINTGLVEKGIRREYDERFAQADANGYTLVDVFTDAGISGKRADNRPGLLAALDAVCKARDTALVIYSLSRLARSTMDAIAIAERLVDFYGLDMILAVGYRVQSPRGTRTRRDDRQQRAAVPHAGRDPRRLAAQAPVG
jgi:hypothetical protein